MEAARLFRACLEAVARSGTIHRVVGAAPPPPLSPAMGALIPTLRDPDAPRHLAGAVDAEAPRTWIAFHAGAPTVPRAACVFAARPWKALLPLTGYPLANAERPERSATLIAEVERLAPEGEPRRPRHRAGGTAEPAAGPRGGARGRGRALPDGARPPLRGGPDRGAPPHHPRPDGGRLMDVAAQGGERAIDAAHAWLASERRGDSALPEIARGADDTTNAVSIRRFLQRTAGVATTTGTSEATLIPTRHRIPKTPLREGQILVHQAPLPEPLPFLEPRETGTRRMHALSDYDLMHVKLYEGIARHGGVATACDHPVLVEGRCVMAPAPIPRFDNPKLASPAIQPLDAGREQRIHALPPHTRVESLAFEDHPFAPAKARGACALCGDTESHLDEMIVGDEGQRLFACSDTDHCEGRREDAA